MTLGNIWSSGNFAGMHKLTSQRHLTEDTSNGADDLAGTMGAD